MHRHQLNGGDVELVEVVDDHRVGQAGVGAPEFGRDTGMGLCHAFDMRFVDYGLVVRGARRPVVCPVEERIDHDAGHSVAQRVDHRGSAVRVDGVDVIGIQRLPEGEIAVERLPIRVEQQLAGVTPMAGRRVERPVHTKPVALAGGDVRQIGMPDVPVHLVKRDPRLDAVLVDQT
ncbi:Uncharacterised protein [Mycobacterium tuberculosis]|uniref:Uncharacterized protein n=1 Tax=Mycobacterium tuberculosis TaxID=1773 RepID=A0A654TDN5_MYCTX|nr:Uncharacterised protein [Mycobacterium tuberculosis]CKR64889.1 Uncharacterised protein [Mycobacterium tuberculosis]CKR66028.1 Uncharacterised protein [Mycobacterium tuberculosis]CKS27826.1 Uncharacterised protein [Mycobacterium tuberculosis]CKS72516.1 Uncharacterised protein [Mycobacterium tuberculosis]